MSFEQYLNAGIEKGVAYHVIAARQTAGGRIIFYVHPDGVDGPTLDFYADGNALTPKPEGEVA